MKLLVVSGTSSRTRFDGEPVDCAEVDGSPLEDHLERSPDQVAPAADLFVGREHESVKRAVGHLEDVADVEWWIMTDGFGLVDASTEVLGTDCSFADTAHLRERARSFGLDPEEMTTAETRQAVARELGVRSKLEERAEEFDIVVFALTTPYVEAIAPGLEVFPTGTTGLAIAAASVSGSLGDCHWLPATDRERVLIGSNWASLRGDLLERFVMGLDAATIESLAEHPGEAYFRSLGLA